MCSLFGVLHILCAGGAKKAVYKVLFVRSVFEASGLMPSSKFSLSFIGFFFSFLFCSFLVLVVIIKIKRL